ncbi:energy-coupling factor transporter transmembrane protein EcfT [Deinococcus sp. VB343]|uniref:Energy-coupling factor transporter transmembrane protein EcfT n=1 Tax=Deinococcus sp. VB142 TaxID=3112952 RepID=A0AAU6Q0I8_9DEIO
MTLGLYVPRESPLHRLRPAPKLVAVLVAGVVVFWVRDWRVLLALLALTLSLYGLARLGWRASWVQLRPSLGVLLFLFVVQSLLADVESGAVTVLRFGVLLLLSSLVTLTTRVSDLLAALERAMQPLARVGVNPAKVSLAVSLTLRFIPVVVQTVNDVRDAQRARGSEKNMVALTVPVIVRTLKMADDVADAIEARSWE